MSITFLAFPWFSFCNVFAMKMQCFCKSGLVSGVRAGLAISGLSGLCLVCRHGLASGIGMALVSFLPLALRFV